MSLPTRFTANVSRPGCADGEGAFVLTGDGLKMFRFRFPDDVWRDVFPVQVFHCVKVDGHRQFVFGNSPTGCTLSNLKELC